MVKKYTTVIFDLDGTLLDSIDDLKTSINIVMKEYGYGEHTRDEVRSYINDGSRMLITRALPENERNEENITRVHNRYLEVYSEHVNEETYAYNGTKELVSRLSNEGYKLAVVSNKPDKHVQLLAKYFYGQDAFSYITGGGNGLPVKPDKECVERALEIMGSNTNEAVYIGDSHVDVKTARNGGIKCIGVTWGFHGKAGFKDEIPDFYADDTDTVYKIVSGEII